MLYLTPLKAPSGTLRIAQTISLSAILPLRRQDVTIPSPIHGKICTYGPINPFLPEFLFHVKLRKFIVELHFLTIETQIKSSRVEIVYRNKIIGCYIYVTLGRRGDRFRDLPYHTKILFLSTIYTHSYVTFYT